MSRDQKRDIKLQSSLHILRQAKKGFEMASVSIPLFYFFFFPLPLDTSGIFYPTFVLGFRVSSSDFKRWLGPFILHPDVRDPLRIQSSGWMAWPGANLLKCCLGFENLDPPQRPQRSSSGIFFPSHSETPRGTRLDLPALSVVSKMCDPGTCDA